MGDGVIITAMICATVLCLFWMSLNQPPYDGGDEE